MKQKMRAFTFTLAAISFPINLCVSFLDSMRTNVHMVTYIDIYYSMHIGTQTQFLIYLSGDYDYAKKCAASWFFKNNTVDP